VAEPLRLDRQIPPALLFVQPTQQQVHLAVVLPIAMVDTRHTASTLARLDDSHRHFLSSLPHLPSVVVPTLLSFGRDR
jgi:hypothetical protein